MDYRTSHAKPGKGDSYARTFSQFPYRRMVWDWEKERLSNILERRFNGRTDIRYLDFACGTGRILGYLEGRVGSSIGVDVSDSMLSVARRHLKSSRLHQNDITREHIFPENSFDLITAFRFFLNAQWKLKSEAMKELCRILSDDGYLVFNMHLNADCLLARIIKIGSIVKPSFARFNTMSINDAIQLAESAGLKILEIHHFGMIPIPSEKVHLPYNWINKLELRLSRLKVMRKFSRFLIFVCVKAPA